MCYTNDVPQREPKGETTMIAIVLNTNTIAKFERWESNKAMDWLTQKGLYVTGRTFIDNTSYWMCQRLP